MNIKSKTILLISLFAITLLFSACSSKKKCNTKLKQNQKNKKIVELILRAENWLKNNSYKTTIIKWETKAWGEIPADFGRK